MFLNTPVFIPKAKDSTLCDVDYTFPAMLLDAQTAIHQKNLIHKVKSTGAKLIINPATHRLQNVHSQRKSFKALPYFIPEEEINKLYSDATFRLEKFVKPCIQFQIDQGADALVAPYFYGEDIHSQTFLTGLSALSDSLIHLKARENSLPRFAVVNISAHLLRDISALDYVRSRYSDDFKGLVDGYIVIVDGLEERTADLDTLRGYAHLVYQLSQDNNVYAFYVGGFGEVLCAVGSQGFISGAGSNESFSLKSYAADKKTFGRRQEFIYIPEVFNYMNEQDVNKIGYTCNCKACGGGLPVDSVSKRQHYLYRKSMITEEMQKLSQPARIDYMISRLENAQSLTAKYLKDFAVQVKIIHLERWVAVLKEARGWHGEKESEEILSSILDEIDKGDDQRSS